MQQSKTMPADSGDLTGEGMAVAGWGPSPHAGVHAALLLASAALLTLEVSLTRFFSFTIWYHFAYLTISVALLGFGATGSIVAAFPRLFAARGQALVVAALLAAAASTAGGLAFLARHPIQIENVLNKPLQFSASLSVYYLVVGAPFLLAGFAVATPFAAWPSRMGRLYFWDLLGAALGCAGVVALVEVLGVPGLVFAACALLVAAAAALELGSGRRGRGGALAALSLVVLAAAGPAGEALPVLVTASKNFVDLASEPDLPEFASREDRFSKWTALNRVDAFGWAHPSPYSFWARIGVAPSFQGATPPSAKLTYDGSNGSDIYPFSGDVESEFAFLDHHLLRVPYLLLEEPRVLAIGVGGGIDLFNAVKQGAAHVTGVELQPETVRLHKETLRAFNGGFFHRDDVTLVAGEGRHFVRKTGEVFDLVQVTAVDTFAAQAAGAYVLAESYLYTADAVDDYLDVLADDGTVAMVVGDIRQMDGLPPLVSRLAMMGLRALERRGAADPGRHIVVAASYQGDGIAQTGIAVIRKAPFSDAEVERVASFLHEEGFAALWMAGRGGPAPLAPLLGDDEELRRRTLEEGWFDLEAPTDENPFFYNVGRWRNLSPSRSILYTMPGSFIGQLVLLLMVAQSTLLGLVLVLAPLLRGAAGELRAPGVASYLAYFLALGLGFMFVEISFVQSFVLFLGSPTYALSVTIFALLLFSALGSLASTRLAARPRRALARLAPALAVLVTAYAFGLSRVFDAALHLELGERIAVAVAAQMPLGLVLGMFMPLGVACIAREHPRLVPWAWGVNGVGSVSGTTLAVLLAMAAGFPAVAMTAAALYLAGTALLLKASRGA